MNTVIRYVMISPKLSYRELEFYERFLSKERREKIEKYHFEKDKICSLTAGLLARQAVMQELNLQEDQLNFTRKEMGKPYLRDYPEFEFSLSHTGGCVAIAFSDRPLGIDVEKIKEMKWNVARRYFLSEEQNYIAGCTDKALGFCEIWTRKEAFIKMTGEGLRRALDSFSVLDDKDYYTEYLREEGYVLSLYQKNLDCNHLSVEKVEIEELLTYFDQIERVAEDAG